jgi:hypothetical protein
MNFVPLEKNALGFWCAFKRDPATEVATEVVRAVDARDPNPLYFRAPFRTAQSSSLERDGADVPSSPKATE